MDPILPICSPQVDSSRSTECEIQWVTLEVCDNLCSAHHNWNPENWLIPFPVEMVIPCLICWNHLFSVLATRMRVARPYLSSKAVR